MFGKFLKGSAFCAMLGLSCVGGLTLVPDKHWESFPSNLTHVRAQLAKYHIAPLKYCEELKSGVVSDGASLVPEPEEDRYARQDANESRTLVRIGPRVAHPVYELDRKDPERGNAYDIEEIEGGGGGASRYADDNLRSDPPSGAKPSLFSGASTVDNSDGGGVPAEPASSDPAPFADDEFAGADPFEQNGETGTEPGYLVENLSSNAVVSDADVDATPYAQNESVADQAGLDDTTVYADEPGIGAAESLDDVLVDRRALAEVESASATNLAEAAAPSALTAEPSASLADAASSGSVANTANELGAAPAIAQIPEQQGYLADPAVVTQGVSAVENAPAAQNVPAIQSAPAAQNAAVAQNAPAAKVKSFDEYLNESNARAQAKPTAELSPAATQGYIQETSAVVQVPKASDAVDLNALLSSLSQPCSDERVKEIFIALNRYYDTQYASASAQDQANAIRALDHLAYEIFYSPKRSIMEAPRQVREGDTLVMLAREYNVNPEYIAGVNGLDPNAALTPGTTLKIARGPVTATVSVARKELTLRINGLYAGRFKCGVPQVSAGVRGEFLVATKLKNPPCDAVGVDGNKINIPGGDPSNPLGACWIGLQNGPGLQGTNRPELVGGSVQENGGFLFSNQEISQLNALLQIGSTVTFVD